MQAVNVETLLKLCKEQVDKGNGKKIVLLSDDDEGNGYHTLFYHFTDGSEFEGQEELFHDGQRAEDVIILG